MHFWPIAVSGNLPCGIASRSCAAVPVLITYKEVVIFVFAAGSASATICSASAMTRILRTITIIDTSLGLGHVSRVPQPQRLPLEIMSTASNLALLPGKYRFPWRPLSAAPLRCPVIVGIRVRVIISGGFLALPCAVVVLQPRLLYG